LGDNCYTTWMLRNSGLQTSSFPLDWLNSFNLSNLVKFLNDESCSFINRLDKSPFQIDKEKMSVLYSHELKFRFPHEFDKHPSNTLGDIYTTYLRRLNRMRKISEASNKVVFIRWISTDNFSGDAILDDQLAVSVSALELERALEALCGHDRFSIIFLTNQPGFFDQFKRPSQKFLFCDEAISLTLCAPESPIKNELSLLYRNFLDDIGKLDASSTANGSLNELFEALKSKHQVDFK